MHTHRELGTGGWADKLLRGDFAPNIKHGLSLFSLGVSVCTNNRQVEHPRCSRTGRVQKTHKILREKHHI